MILVKLTWLLFSATPDALSTYAEKTAFTETGRFAEVEQLCAQFPKSFPKRVKCEQFGTTPLGRPMLALIASDDGVFSLEDAKKKNRPVVLMQGAIHAGEIDGKDALLFVLRDLLNGKELPGILKKITVVFVPVFNIDGHERFSKNNRPNQIGPREMGWRVTSQNLNLNRDYLKAEAPEMHAMLGLLRKYDPILYADLHVTDGAKFQHDVSVTFEPWLTGAEELRTLGKSMKVSLFAELETKKHLPVGFYPSFEKQDDPMSGFAYTVAPPRFSTTYWALHNRFGLLVETHSWKDYATRVKATVDVVLGLLRMASEDGPRWLKAAQKADAERLALIGKDVPLVFDNTKNQRALDFLGYVFKREKSDVSGQDYISYDDTKPQIWTVPYFDEVIPVLTVKMPTAYLIPAPHVEWVKKKLEIHGIEFSILKNSMKSSHSFRAVPKFKPTSSEGKQTVEVSGEWKSEVFEHAPGTLMVPMKQRLSVLAMHLLEPKAPDSLVSWGFFNAHFEQKEYLEDYVTEVFAREQLKIPEVKKEFDEKLKDEAFAKNSGARLKFFADRHASKDERLNLVPIFRVE
jgi:murein tripeptide amidase MpaA